MIGPEVDLEGNFKNRTYSMVKTPSFIKGNNGVPVKEKMI
jgi:hypothetical protein